ncbi:MAG: FecR domain-containing protein, partial [Acidobacteriota bacterium]
MASSVEPTTAAEWMARLRSDRVTPEDHAAYQEWLATSPEHRESAANLAQVWQAVGVLENDPMVQAVLAAPDRSSRSRWQTSPALRLAAGLLLSLSLGFFALLAWRTLDARDSYETVSGEQRIVDLADGSRLHLNVMTRLEVALGSEVRDVRLVRGQAFFEVAPDAARPFIVTAGDKEITVVGTKFDVLLQGGDTRVTVIEGQVAVTSLGAANVGSTSST